MKLPITITQVAQQPKILPLNKIIKSSDFTIKQLNPNTVISKEDENIRPTEVGTIVDYLSRYVLLADEHAFDVANAKAKQDLIHGIIPVKEYKKLLDQEERLRYLVKDLSDVDSLSDEAIYLATDICAWEDAFRSGRYVKPKAHTDKLTIEHIKMMIQRVEEFFEEFGWPIRDAFFAKIYQKRPIYWEFNSGRNKGFKALMYLHRYNTEQLPMVRHYLHELQPAMNDLIEVDQNLLDQETTASTKSKYRKAIATLNKQMNEIMKYDQILDHLSQSPVDLDLDDGVLVNHEKLQQGEKLLSKL